MKLRRALRRWWKRTTSGTVTIPVGTAQPAEKKPARYTPIGDSPFPERGKVRRTGAQINETPNPDRSDEEEAARIMAQLSLRGSICPGCGTSGQISKHPALPLREQQWVCGVCGIQTGIVWFNPDLVWTPYKQS